MYTRVQGDDDELLVVPGGPAPELRGQTGLWVQHN